MCWNSPRGRFTLALKEGGRGRGSLGYSEPAYQDGSRVLVLVVFGRGWENITSLLLSERNINEAPLASSQVSGKGIPVFRGEDSLSSLNRVFFLGHKLHGLFELLPAGCRHGIGILF